MSSSEWSMSGGQAPAAGRRVGGVRHLRWGWRRRARSWSRSAPTETRRQRRLRRPRKSQPLRALPVLELTRAEGDEVERGTSAARSATTVVAGAVQASASRCSAGGELRVAPLAARLRWRQISVSSSLTTRVEEVDDLLRVEQRIEAVVGAQLEQLVELALRLLGLVLEQVRDAQHAVRLDDLALAVEQHLGVEQRVQDLDGALVLGAPERRLARDRRPRAAWPPGAGARRRHQERPRQRRQRDRGSFGSGARLQLHDVGDALAGADANLLGGEGVAGVDGDLDLLAASRRRRRTGRRSPRPGAPRSTATLRLGSLTMTRAAARPPARSS